MRYVHVADHHHRDAPELVAKAGQGELEVTKRVVAMLGARGQVDRRGTRWHRKVGV